MAFINGQVQYRIMLAEHCTSCGAQALEVGSANDRCKMHERINRGANLPHISLALKGRVLHAEVSSKSIFEFEIVGYPSKLSNQLFVFITLSMPTASEQGGDEVLTGFPLWPCCSSARDPSRENRYAPPAGATELKSAFITQAHRL
jgi:hypothetical protein